MYRVVWKRGSGTERMVIEKEKDWVVTMKGKRSAWVRVRSGVAWWAWWSWVWHRAWRIVSNWPFRSFLLLCGQISREYRHVMQRAAAAADCAGGTVGGGAPGRYSPPWLWEDTLHAGLFVRSVYVYVFVYLWMWVDTSACAFVYPCMYVCLYYMRNRVEVRGMYGLELFSLPGCEIRRVWRCTQLREECHPRMK